jgi:hypothetical protein
MRRNAYVSNVRQRDAFQSIPNPVALLSNPPFGCRQRIKRTFGEDIKMWSWYDP